MSTAPRHAPAIIAPHRCEPSKLRCVETHPPGRKERERRGQNRCRDVRDVRAACGNSLNAHCRGEQSDEREARVAVTTDDPSGVESRGRPEAERLKRECAGEDAMPAFERGADAAERPRAGGEGGERDDGGSETSRYPAAANPMKTTFPVMFATKTCPSPM